MGRGEGTCVFVGIFETVPWYEAKQPHQLQRVIYFTWSRNDLFAVEVYIIEELLRHSHAYRVLYLVAATLPPERIICHKINNTLSKEVSLRCMLDVRCPYRHLTYFGLKLFSLPLGIVMISERNKMFFRYSGLGTDYFKFFFYCFFAMSDDCCMHALDLMQALIS